MKQINGVEIGMPSLSQFKDGVREDPGVAFVFFEYFLPGVVGRKKYKNVVAFKIVSKIATISDEAFAILLLENSWNKWEDELAKRTKDPSKLTPTKWTSSKTQGKRYCGWHKEGILRFNELCNAVKNDRIKDMQKPLAERVEHQYLKMKNKQMEDKNRNKDDNNNGEPEPSTRTQVYQDSLDHDDVEPITVVPV